MNNRGHILQKIDERFEDLLNQVLHLGAQTLTQLEQITASMTGGALPDIAQVREREQQINADEARIDRTCKTLLARFNPTASDLRFILGISKINGHIERIADEAVKIAEGLVTLNQGLANDPEKSELVRHFIDMLVHCKDQLRASLTAFEASDVDNARSIIGSDLQIDQEYRGLLRAYVEYMDTHPGQAESTMGLWIVTKAAERLADHAKHISEATIYIVNGQ